MKKAIVLMKDDTEQVVEGADGYLMDDSSPILRVYRGEGEIAFFCKENIIGVKLAAESTREPAESEEVCTRDIGAGDIVRHFKSNPNTKAGEYVYYIEDTFAIDTKTGERCVVYMQYPEENKYGRRFVRPYKEFYGEVDKTKYPDAKQKYRFEKVEE